MSIAHIKTEIEEYAEIAGKDIEDVYEEVKQFIVGKKVEAQNATAAAANTDPKSAA